MFEQMGTFGTYLGMCGGNAAIMLGTCLGMLDTDWFVLIVQDRLAQLRTCAQNIETSDNTCCLLNSVVLC